ncbi:hypothetical protein [Salirhabdus sp. Marseille-P4669]|uniref:hypothetical protein n=1 Tax=Salirhabdus sp. Marseille-P4669 TaxID=2042310 RepID=UPI0013578970|nr:hypothetical protein [Salirhabdus sp. Marseille-P4669]
MNTQNVTSFVVRFQKQTDLYRIKVTHVQKEEEWTFERMEDVFEFMKNQIDEAYEDC